MNPLDPLKASDLIKLLQKHIERNGDTNVMLYDDYDVSYKTINKTKISRDINKNFVIQCDHEKDEERFFV